MKICTNNKTMTAAHYAYDALGRRIGKYDAETTFYYYNDQWQILAEYDGSAFGNSYVYGNYIDEVLVMNDGADDTYYAHDPLYSPAALLDDTGAVVERCEYDAYGSVQILNSAFSILNSSQYGNPFTFTGRQLDTLDAGALHHMHYRHRDYSPKLGRFCQHDPLGIVPNSEETVMSPFADHWFGLNLFTGQNLYEYTYSAPLIYLDPAGLFGQCGPGFIGGIIVPDDPWPFGGANFTDACKAHDACYEGKGPTGCFADQKDCDDAFRDAMYDACDAKYGNKKDWFGNPRADWCKQKIADKYHNAVVEAGEPSFEKGQKKGECPGPCPGATPGIGPGGPGGGVIRF